MLVMHGEQRLFIGAALAFGEKPGKFVLAGQFGCSALSVRHDFESGILANSGQCRCICGYSGLSATAQGLTKMRATYILLGSPNRFLLLFRVV
jgi:hypothetical protein